jgi:hypothetical protein
MLITRESAMRLKCVGNLVCYTGDAHISRMVVVKVVEGAR